MPHVGPYETEPQDSVILRSPIEVTLPRERFSPVAGLSPSRPSLAQPLDLEGAVPMAQGSISGRIDVYGIALRVRSIRAPTDGAERTLEAPANAPAGPRVIERVRGLLQRPIRLREAGP